MSSQFPAKKRFPTDSREALLLCVFFQRLRIVFQDIAGLTVQHLADGRQGGEPDDAVKRFFNIYRKIFYVLYLSDESRSSFVVQAGLIKHILQ